MKSQELRQRNSEELYSLLKELKEKLQNMKFELSQGKVKNTAMLRLIRKDIGRILTILRERELNINSSHKNYDKA